MSDKHGDNKKKHDPKEQRKPRGSRKQVGKSDKKNEKSEEVISSSKVSVPQKPPVYEDPGPEFYKNLKRETDDIIKITEEENSKYKKKEIQSNWAKYEMPIESYEETEEQDVGADYDKLIQMPLSAGGHFQFKHEKSWDTTTGPSPYDKYFEINMDTLSTAISSIPFYERNNVDKSLFSETDILTMDTRATKYKQKYYNDKKYSTAETEAQDRIYNLLKNDDKVVEADNDRKINDSVAQSDIEEETNINKCTDIVLEFNEKTVNLNEDRVAEVNSETLSKELNDLGIEDIHKDYTARLAQSVEHETLIHKDLVDTEKQSKSREIEALIPPIDIESNEAAKGEPSTGITTKSAKLKTKDASATPKSNPVIESPEDLEKWLDDFLDE